MLGVSYRNPNRSIDNGSLNEQTGSNDATNDTTINFVFGLFNFLR